MREKFVAFMHGVEEKSEEQPELPDPEKEYSFYGFKGICNSTERFWETDICEYKDPISNLREKYGPHNET